MARLPALKPRSGAAAAPCPATHAHASAPTPHTPAGTFERYNTTLYVLYEGAGSLELPTLRRLLEENFSEWGPLASVYIVPKKTIAFVKYLWRVSAEFAKVRGGGNHALRLLHAAAAAASAQQQQQQP